MNICTWLYTERNGKKRCFGAVVFPFFSVHERSQGEPACGRIFYDPAVNQIANVRFTSKIKSIVRLQDVHSSRHQLCGSSHHKFFNDPEEDHIEDAQDEVNDQRIGVDFKIAEADRGSDRCLCHNIHDGDRIQK